MMSHFATIVEHLELVVQNWFSINPAWVKNLTPVLVSAFQRFPFF